VLASNPTREFDGRWGKGVVSPAMFTQRVFNEQKQEAEKTE
jgi:hypothetical protein